MFSSRNEKNYLKYSLLSGALYQIANFGALTNTLPISATQIFAAIYFTIAYFSGWVFHFQYIQYMYMSTYVKLQALRLKYQRSVLCYRQF